VMSYFLRRLLAAAATMVGITMITFLVLHLTPGEPGPGLAPDTRGPDPATVQALRDRYGLDRPLASQYLAWAGRVARLDFGRSLVDHRPVRRRILERLPYTLALNLAALAVIFTVAIPLGALAASRRGSPADRASGITLYALYALPSFWVAILLQAGLAVGLGWFPLAGIASPEASSWNPPLRWLDTGWHMVLPVFCLSYGSLAFFARFARANLLEALASESIRAARSRGLGPGRVLWRHALGQAWIPFLTLAGLLLPTLVSGSVLIERIFAWPGLGGLMYESLFTRDYPTILGLTSLTAILVVAGTLMADMLYLVADPRLRRPAEPS
jgi:peptide/nickel transport system permease protein